MRRALLALFLAAAGCHDAALDVVLVIRQPPDRMLMGTVTQLVMRAARDGQTLLQSTFAGTASHVSLGGVPYGPDTVFTLDGLSASNDSLAHGSSCAVDFEKTQQTVDLYLAPVHLFFETAGAPGWSRSEQQALTTASGDALIAGGLEGGVPTTATSRFQQSTSTFVDAGFALTVPRAGAQVSSVAAGALLTGGTGENGAVLDSAELYYAATGRFVPISNASLGARRDHRATPLPGDRVLLSGGYDASGAVLDTTAIVSVQSDGSTQVTSGPQLTTPRASHASILSVGTPVLLGGYDATGKPLASIEALTIADDGDIGAFQTIANLQFARAEATATLLGDGSILVVGGNGSDGHARGDAEVYNPITQTTRLYNLASTRRGHTATALADGRVLIVGGVDDAGTPIRSNELFVMDVGFVSEHELVTARSGHSTLTLCDGTVLVVGGASDAELYMPAPD